MATRRWPAHLISDELTAAVKGTSILDANLYISRCRWPPASKHHRCGIRPNGATFDTGTIFYLSLGS